MKKSKWLGSLLVVLLIVGLTGVAFAEPAFPVPKVGIDIEQAKTPQETVASIQILLMLTFLALAPSILIMMTSFTRILIVLSFLRNALGTQQMPPNQILIGLSLFLTLFIMMPVTKEINDKALTPFSSSQISQQQALDSASGTIKTFMLKQLKSEKELEFFTQMAEIKTPVKKEDLPLRVVIPAFMISELTIAFKMGFVIFLPFLVIDMVVASALMSMGMMMLPPVMISLPFKILLFITVGGWQLTAETLVRSFNK